MPNDILVEWVSGNPTVTITPKNGCQGCLVLAPTVWAHPEADKRLFMEAVAYVGFGGVVKVKIPSDESCVRVDLPEDQTDDPQHPGTKRGIGGYLTSEEKIEAAVKAFFAQVKPGDPVIVK